MQLFENEVYRQVFDTMHEGFVIGEIISGEDGKPEDFRVLLVNRAMERLSGGRFTVAATTGKAARDIQPNYESYWLDLFAKVVSTGQPAARIDYVVALDGWYDTRAFSLGGSRFAYLYQEITEQKRRELSLRESEERLKSMVEASPFPAIIHSEDGMILVVNPAWTRLSGYRPEDIPTVMDWIRRAYGEDQREMLRHVKSLAFQDRMTSNREYTIRTADGRRRTWDFYSGPLGADKMGRKLFLCTAADVTDRVQAEAALQESEARFRTLADNMSQMAWIVNAKGESLWYNRRWYEFTGSTFEFMKGSGWQALFHPDHLNKVAAKFLRHLESGEAWEDTYLLQGRDGQFRWFLSRAVPVHDSQGRIIQWFGTNTDVNDQKRAEEELAKFALLVEASNDFIALADFEGRCTFLNSAGRDLVGLEPGKESGKDLREFFLTDIHRSAPDPFGTAIKEGIWQGEVPLRHFQTGKAIHILGNLFVLRSPETGTPVALAAVCRDLTLIREKEEQLRQSQKMDAIGKLAGGIAHDFNNLLTAINGYCDMLLESVPAGDVKHEFLEEIRKSGQKAASLTAQLLAYSRKQVLQPKVLNLNTLVEEDIRLLKRLIGENIEIQMDMAPDLMAVKVDPNQIHRILLNLCLNARDAMPQGGQLSLETRNVRLEAPLVDRHASLAPGAYVVLGVRDTGIGMDREVQERIFEPFFTTKELGKGTGLGLSSVYGILQQSGGGIQFESEPGKGTSFRAYLPGFRKEQMQAEENASPEASPRKRLQGSILLVEDEDSVRKFTRTLLEADGYSVLEASEGAAALALLESPEADPDLLITDVMMPKMGGFHLAEAVKRIRPRIPILFTSGYTEETLVLQGRLNEGVFFLQKPFSPKLLASKVEEILASKEVNALNEY